MLRKLKIKWIKWIDWVNLDKASIYEAVKKHDFHELDIEACLEENQRTRIDSYDDYIFMVLHFPKYNPRTKIYYLNEFNIFLWKDFLITLKNFWWIHFDDIFERYSKLDIEWNIDLKISSWYILYEIIQSILEKMFRLTLNVKKDIKEIEKQVFDRESSTLVKDIMIKKRNIVVLKHMFKPQISVLKLLEHNVNKLFKWKMEVYFEDLEDKLEHIVSDINILEEYIESVEDAFKTIIDIKTNFIIKLLTIFSAFLLPLTLITSFYGMNINLPFYDQPYFVYILLVISVFIMLFIYIFFRKNWRF